MWIWPNFIKSSVRSPENFVLSVTQTFIAPINRCYAVTITVIALECCRSFVQAIDLNHASELPEWRQTSEQAARELVAECNPKNGFIIMSQSEVVTVPVQIGDFLKNELGPATSTAMPKITRISVLQSRNHSESIPNSQG